jgi:hypothetical protein
MWEGSNVKSTLFALHDARQPLLTAEDYQSLQGNTKVLNVALLAEDGSKVWANARDLYQLWPWFKVYVDNSERMTASGDMLEGVRLPHDVSRDILQEVITAIYRGNIEISPTNLLDVMQLADAVQVSAWQSLPTLMKGRSFG